LSFIQNDQDMSGLLQPDDSRISRLPQRVLLVDDDELELELMADRLRSLGFETHTVSDGSAALDLLRTQSFPLVITDWQMPRMDGIQMTERLRSEGDNETFIIMLTVLDDASSHERGYFAGVDDYLSKRAPDAKVVMAIRAAFKAVEMRRALRAAKEQQGGEASGDANSAVLIDRMRAEVKRAARYHRELSILVLQLDSDSGTGVADVMQRAVEIVADRIRTDIDFSARYRGSDGVPRLAVVLPETPRAAALQVGGRLCVALTEALQTPLETFTARVGWAEFIPGQQTQPAAQIADNVESLLRAAEAQLQVPSASTAQPRPGEAG
jgi:two-component system, cell cycle response regulator